MARQLYEIRDAGTKGMGLFATADIALGTEILDETVLAIVFELCEQHTTHQNQWRSQKYWDKLRIQEQETSSVDILVEEYLAGIGTRGRSLVEKMRKAKPEFTNRANTFFTNRLPISSNSWEVFFLGTDASLINHACIANANLKGRKHNSTTHRAIVCLKALRDIRAGEEITISYLESNYGPVGERRERMQELFRFRCTCDRCQSKDQAQRELDDEYAKAACCLVTHFDRSVLREEDNKLILDPDSLIIKIPWKFFRIARYVLYLITSLGIIDENVARFWSLCGIVACIHADLYRAKSFFSFSSGWYKNAMSKDSEGALGDLGRNMGIYANDPKQHRWWDVSHLPLKGKQIDQRLFPKDRNEALEHLFMSGYTDEAYYHFGAMENKKYFDETREYWKNMVHAEHQKCLALFEQELDDEKAGMSSLHQTKLKKKSKKGKGKSKQGNAEPPEPPLSLALPDIQHADAVGGVIVVESPQLEKAEVFTSGQLRSSAGNEGEATSSTSQDRISGHRRERPRGLSDPVPAARTVLEGSTFEMQERIRWRQQEIEDASKEIDDFRRRVSTLEQPSSGVGGKTLARPRSLSDQAPASAPMLADNILELRANIHLLQRKIDDAEFEILGLQHQIVIQEW